MPSYPNRWHSAKPALLAPICAVLVALGLPAAEVPGAAAGGSSEPVRPLPKRLDLDGDKVALGDRLLHDKRLSKNDSLSCAGCHDLGKGGDDDASTLEALAAIADTVARP